MVFATLTAAQVAHLDMITAKRWDRVSRIDLRRVCCDGPDVRVPSAGWMLVSLGQSKAFQG